MRGVGYGLMDVLVVAACSLTFAAVIGAVRGEPGRPPIERIAQDLGTTPEAFQRAADPLLRRHPPGPPSEAQKQQIATALDVSVERLESVMEKYRPDRLRQR
jgi:hypothetical protein